MAKSARGTSEVETQEAPGFQVTLTFDGELADRGELPAAELGAALQGWDRFLQLAYYSQETSVLELPKSGTSFRVEFHVRKISKGSFLVDATLWFGVAAVGGIIGNRADAIANKLWEWSSKIIKAHIKAKREKKTLDGVVAELETLAKAESVRVSKNREDSEDFATAVNTALTNATVPLDSSAAKEVLALKGQAVDIVIDQNGRAAIRAPFDPPALDPEADPVIDAPVKFIRINKKTGYGLFQFVRPQDESQLGQQRFHCEDKAIRRRANQYTGSFHEDIPLKVRMQRKAYETSRHGHYWLIVGTGAPDVADQGLFGPHDGAKKGKKRKKK
ncbi:MAG: hypothetical protein SFY69_12500 [Planctomycetota bacterium]|nr:hypothetical protein [Planctomycetota bacterium]